MGRRKIEITPITHERNRSVTFLKRKNGLFKKAYELGVLCSVDVAVIIFEERAGHHVKLHEYCSTDVDNMVQRHIHFDGERESKHPADFSKQPDDGAHDDDDDDDEGPRPSGSGGASSARRPSGSSGGTMGGNAGMSGRSGGGMSMSGRGAPGIGGMGSGGRVAGGMNMGLDIDYRPSSLSLPPHISSSFPSHSLPAHSFPSHSTHGLSHLSAPSFPSHTQHPSLSAHLSTQPQSQHSYSQSPTSAYPGPGSAIPVSLERHSPFNFSLPQTKRPRLDSSASSGGGTYPGGPSAYTIDDPGAHAAYLQNQNQNQGHAQSGGGGNNARSFYGQQTHGQASPPPSNASSTPSNANSNLFSGLLGTGGGGSPTATSPHHSHPPRGGSGTGLDLEWPVHSSSQAQSQQIQSRPSAGQGGSDTAWLDFFSSAPASGSVPRAGAAASSSSNINSGTSNASSAAGSSSTAAGSSSTATLSTNASTLGKRTRSDSYLGGGVDEEDGPGQRVKEEDPSDSGAGAAGGMGPRHSVSGGGSELDIFGAGASSVRESKTSDVRSGGAGDNRSSQRPIDTHCRPNGFITALTTAYSKPASLGWL